MGVSELTMSVSSDSPTKSGSLNFLELSGSVQACTRIALPLTPTEAFGHEQDPTEWGSFIDYEKVRLTF
jgi:hypothetical protein